VSGPLSIVAVGHVHAESVATLTQLFAPVEQLELDVAPQSVLESHRAELNRAIDAGSSDWVLIVREHEVVDPLLAAEIAEAAVSSPRAFGFRIQSIPWYNGAALRVGPPAAELRLFHRRHLLRRGDLNVQGTVVRLAAPLRSVTFTTVEEHRTYLHEHAVPHSWLRRVLLFLRNAIGSQAHDRNTLTYLWVEAGFDSQKG
jgi:hypothetical protein